MKYKTCSHLKRGLWTTGQQSSSSQTMSVVQEWLNKRNTTTVAKFLDTSVCGGSWCLDPRLSPFLVKFTQILESILLDNPHKAAVLSVGCASFSSTLFPSTQLPVNMLGYSTLWTASFFGNECLWLTLLVKGVNHINVDTLNNKKISLETLFVEQRGFNVNKCSVTLLTHAASALLPLKHL